MSGSRAKPVLVFVASLLSVAAAIPAAGQSQQAPKRNHPVKKEQPAPALEPPPPSPPLTLEQMPASPPKVLFRDGMLTIVAENSTLGDVLRAVRSQTGAAVEVPGNATERVVSNLGPGPARDVLAALLNGSHFNYVMLGSPTNPALVERIILTSKSGGELPAGQANANGVNQANEGEGQGNIPLAQEPEEMPNEEAASADDAGDADNQPESQANPDENQPPQPANGQPAVKTPEQLLRELQQQQQQQNVPQGAPAPPNPIPRQPPR